MDRRDREEAHTKMKEWIWSEAQVLEMSLPGKVVIHSGQSPLLAT